MKKSQEAYRKALKALDEAVKSTRTAHQSEIDKLNQAQEAVDGLPRSADAVTQAKKALAKAQLDEVKSGFRPRVEAIYGEYDAAVAKIRGELCQALHDVALVRASDVDQRALVLLQSGVMMPPDLLQMCRDFSENAAVLSLVRMAAEKQLENTEDGNELAVLTRVLEESNTGGTSYIMDFDNVVQSTLTISSRDRFGNFPDRSGVFSVGLDAWEDLVAPILAAAELEDAE